MKKWAIFLLALLWVSPLGADTLTPAQTYNRTARDIISQCSRVSVSYDFVDDQVEMAHLWLGKVGLTPHNAALLANAITVDQKVTDRLPITSNDQWLSFDFYNGKKVVATANAKISGKDGNIVLGELNHYIFHYTLTPQSSKLLLNWVLKQPRLAKKFPH